MATIATTSRVMYLNIRLLIIQSTLIKVYLFYVAELCYEKFYLVIVRTLHNNTC